ncbi:hypothetical protein [Shewanella scandinavica]|uniref:hypothetical protein n=1 Tax=Shewanella scandinavica TaxID=3063538 RepID=UPI00318A5BBF
MAPAINGGYAKDLSTSPQGIERSPIIYQKYFFNPLDSSLYKMTEYHIKGSEYRGCIEVHELVYGAGDGYALEYAKFIFDEKNDNIAAAVEAISLGIPTEQEKLIARYVYSNILIHEADETVEGKQIRGAYVDSEYEQAKITREVYLTLLNRYGTLVSDSQQSVKGHLLWAYGVCRWGSVRVYDRNEKAFLSTLSHEGDEPENGIAPWSVINIEKNDTTELRRGYWTIEDDLSRLVLVLKHLQN